MLLKFKNSASAFVGVTSYFLNKKGKKMETCFSVEFNITDNIRKKNIDEAFDFVYKDIIKWSGSKKVSVRKWLVDSGFPQEIYDTEPNFVEAAKKSHALNDGLYGRKSSHNFFGHLGAPQENGMSYAEYITERWKNKTNRTFSQYFFNIFESKWVWVDLMKNINQLKSIRQSVACVMDIAFKWDNVEQEPVICWVMKGVTWEHFYEDVFTGEMMLVALCRHMGYPVKGRVHIFCINMSMLRPDRARKFYNKLIELRTNIKRKKIHGKEKQSI